MNMHWKMGFQVFLSLSLMACTAVSPVLDSNQVPEQVVGSDFNPTSKGPKPTLTDGSIITRFDIGQNLSPADFLVLPLTPSTKGPSVKAFRILQEQALFVSQMAKATITVTSPLVEEPVTASLSKDDIVNGWSFVFKGIPEGSASVDLNIEDVAGNSLYQQKQNVQVIAGALTPVDFVIELASETRNCQAQECKGSIAVSVRAITHCFASLKHETIQSINQAILFNIENLEGKVESYSVDFGDQSGNQTVASFPLKHTYTQPGRYLVSMTLNGQDCKNPYTTRSYITLQ